MKFGRCIESYVVTVYVVNDTGTIYNALRKFGTLEFVRCMGENVVNGVRSNEVRLYSLPTEQTESVKSVAYAEYAIGQCPIMRWPLAEENKLILE